MNTVDKFLKATGYNRGDNYPDQETLEEKMEELDVTEDAKIDIYTFFLYDGSPYMCVNCGGGFIKEDIITDEELDADFCTDCHKRTGN